METAFANEKQDKPSVPSDLELIDQILAGKRQQFAVLVERYERMAHATAMRSVHDSHRADDVAQEAFVAAFQSLSSLRDRSNFGGWLLGIVRRKAAQASQQDRRSRTSSRNIGDKEHWGHGIFVELGLILAWSLSLCFVWRDSDLGETRQDASDGGGCEGRLIADL